jgi:hypothetical protein
MMFVSLAALFPILLARPSPREFRLVCRTSLGNPANPDCAYRSNTRRTRRTGGRRRMGADGNKEGKPVGPAVRCVLLYGGRARIVHSNARPMVQGRSRMAIKCAQTPSKMSVARREIARLRMYKDRSGCHNLFGPGSPVYPLQGHPVLLLAVIHPGDGASARRGRAGVQPRPRRIRGGRSGPLGHATHPPGRGILRSMSRPFRLV